MFLMTFGRILYKVLFCHIRVRFFQVTVVFVKINSFLPNCCSFYPPNCHSFLPYCCSFFKLLFVLSNCCSFFPLLFVPLKLLLISLKLLIVTTRCMLFLPYCCCGIRVTPHVATLSRRGDWTQKCYCHPPPSPLHLPPSTLSLPPK